jgi:hypothetical protein
MFVRYEVNVALHGRHLFAAYDREEERDRDRAEMLVVVLKSHFPEASGFSVSEVQKLSRFDAIEGG